MGIEIPAESWQVLVAFGCYLIGVAALGVFAHRYLKRGSFVKEYFLGNRGLGPWVLAMTVAATAISGGTFMGFPSLIYTNGWIMALWICSYMVGPVMTMALLGKRLNQAARVSGAVTVPDIFRDRFGSPLLGVTSTLLILLFLLFNLVAQFKAGGLVMQEAMLLRPSAAQFTGARVDAERNLLLEFQLPDGRREIQKTPLPRENAVYLPERTHDDPDKRQVEVVIRSDNREIIKHVRYPSVKLAWPRVELGYLIGLGIFALTVIAYTAYGGFWAVTWTDVLEGVVMLVGVVVMAILAIRAVPPIETAGQTLTGLAAATQHLLEQDAHLVYGPGPKNFLPLGMAFSFFLMWTMISAGQPSGMVRLMSFKDSASLRRALLLVCGYYILCYMSLLVIFICARAIFPTEYLREIGSEGQPDRIMPAMTRRVAHPLVAGLLLAAPYAAIMSTVAAFLLMISSSLVRDLYQRTINPQVSDRTIKRLSYVGTVLVGVVVMIGAINPPEYLQYIIVFTGTGQGCSFLVPMAMGLYWRRATRAGVLAAMLGGFAVVLLLYVLGWIDNRCQAALREHERQVNTAKVQGEAEPPPILAHTINESLRWLPGWGQKRISADAPLYAGGVDPLVWGLLASLLLGVCVSYATRPDEELLHKYFP